MEKNKPVAYDENAGMGTVNKHSCSQQRVKPDRRQGGGSQGDGGEGKKKLKENSEETFMPACISQKRIYKAPRLH